ncbi:transglutaminase domain-containing protein [Ruminococcaceae bacterium OttesenSCG-928-L11]|nr:transglutaminase domain-containing protein [Ruminococcaceae bacterium OttesenSCG-928-L11]
MTVPIQAAPSKGMAAVRRFIDILFFLIVGTLFVGSMLLAILACTDMRPEPISVFLQVGAVLAVLSVVFCNRYTLISLGGLSLLAALLLTVDVIRHPEAAEYIAAKTLAGETLQYLGGYLPLQPSYETLILGVLSVGMGIFAAFLLLFRYRFGIALALSAVAIGTCMASGFYTDDYARLSLAIYLVSILFLLARQLFLRVELPGAGSGIGFFLLLPVIGICALIAGKLPVPSEESTEQAFAVMVAKPFEAVSDILFKASSQKFFSLETSGYPASGGGAARSRLGGNIELDNYIIMEVDADSEEPIYLTGAVKDFYTGYSWENTTPEIEPALIDDPAQSEDFLELVCSNIVFSLDIGEFEPVVKIMEDASLMKNSAFSNRGTAGEDSLLSLEMDFRPYPEKEAQIRITDSKTYSVFTPLRTTGVEKDGEPLPLMRNGSGALATETLLKDGDSYTVKYRDIINYPLTDLVLWTSRGGIYREVEQELERLHETYDFSKYQASVNLYGQPPDKLTGLQEFLFFDRDTPYWNPDTHMAYEDILQTILIPRADAIRRRYTQLPDTVPERVKRLAASITADAQTDTNRVYMLRNYLLEYPYTWNPGEVPPGRDFVDYFLFDGMQGYCTYYATAFVVMCRSLGIPARYVEGYATNWEPSEGNTYYITSYQAHAWPEVYFEGLGWMILEPTPENRQESTPTPEHLNSVLESYLGYYEDEYFDDYLRMDTDIYATTATGGTTNAPIRPEEPVTRRRLTGQFLLMLLVFCLWPIIRWIAARLSLRRLCRLDNRDAVIAGFRRIQRTLLLLGLRTNPAETANRYADRLTADAVGAVDLNTAAALYSRASYSGGPVSAADKQAMLTLLGETQTFVRHRLGSLRYFVYRYIK